jgi:3-carboxy-cis,cis-muconate cycloisomerase
MVSWAGPVLGVAGPLLVDAEMTAFFSPGTELDAMLAVERALAGARAELGEIDAACLAAIDEAAVMGNVDGEGLARGLARDGVIVPALVRQIRAAIGAPHAAEFHRGATSQDITDTALMMRLKRATVLLGDRLRDLIDRLGHMAKRDGAQTVMARTRFQDALPMTLADRIETWADPLSGLLSTVPERFPVQLAGPIGRRTQAFGDNGDAIAAAVARKLDLDPCSGSWHTDRRAIADIVHWVTGIAAALGKIGHDVALMTQTAVAEVKVSGGGASSAMPHKNNPVQAELLITLARYVAGQRAMLDMAALHENERSGVSWTLEWLALPPAVIGCGAATLVADDLLAKIE